MQVLEGTLVSPMDDVPSILHRRMNILLAIVHQKQLIRVQTNIRTHFGEEGRFWFSYSKLGGIKNPVEVFGQAKFFHDVCRSQVFLICRQVNAYACSVSMKVRAKADAQDANPV